MNAAELMTHPAFAIHPEAPLAQAIRLMTEHKISGLPVAEQNGRLVGVLTEGDLLRRVETGTEGVPRGMSGGWLAGLLMPGREAADFVRTHGRQVQDVMTPGVITVAPETTLPEVIRLMLRHRVKRLPVAVEGRLVGIVSRADLVRRVGAVLNQDTEAGADPKSDDEGLRRAILAGMARQRWAPLGMVSLAVHHGVAQLDGCVFDLRERAALGVLAATTPGVRGVDNRLVCIEPYLGTVSYDPAEPAQPLRAACG